MSQAEATATRILVQTRTHLVPGDDYSDRVRRMKNLICQHYWHRDFDAAQDRWYTYRDNFGYDNRRCYFLVDHGQSPNIEYKPPVVWYKWNGESLTRIERPLPPLLQVKLDEYPFAIDKTQGLRKEPKTVPKPLDGPTRRELIRARLGYNMKIPESEIQFLRDNPGQVEWLKENVEPRLWQRILPEVIRTDHSER